MTRKLLQYHLNEIDLNTPPYGTQRDYKAALSDLALAIVWEVKDAVTRALRERSRPLYNLAVTPDGKILGSFKSAARPPKRFISLFARGDARIVPINEDRDLLLTELNITIPGRK